ncbi:MAG: MBL fold metallo-hydrolase [Nanoarchaeota archaeon]|nr:MBL fold metallo-hydrolase [Nanoarchaeota archaeon]
MAEEIPGIETICENVHLITPKAASPLQSRYCSNIIVLKDSAEEYTLVDTGDSVLTLAMLDVFKKKDPKFDISKITRIILTHTHYDHCFGLRRISERLEAKDLPKIIVSEAETEALEKYGADYFFGSKFFRNLLEHPLLDSLADTNNSMDYQKNTTELFEGYDYQKIREDTTSLKAGGLEWEIMHTSGHTPGSIALYNEHEEILISGDLISKWGNKYRRNLGYIYGYNPFGRTAIEADIPKCLDTLSLLKKKKITIILPGHGNLISNKSEFSAQQTIENIYAYLAPKQKIINFYQSVLNFIGK